MVLSVNNINIRSFHIYLFIYSENGEHLTESEKERKGEREREKDRGEIVYQGFIKSHHHFHSKIIIVFDPISFDIYSVKFIKITSNNLNHNFYI